MSRFASIAFTISMVNAYTQTLADCNAFAALWGNTCTGNTAVTGSTILTDSNYTTLTCTGDATWCVGKDMDEDTTSASCAHNTWTCVTCVTTNSIVMIRVQSNNMPNICWQTNTSNPNVAGYVTVDFEVTWNAAMTGILNYDADDFDTSDDVDFILCDIQRTDESNMHISVSYTEDSSSTSMTTWAGFGRQNIALFNGLALGDTDAVINEGASMDKCLSHASPYTFAQHAHSISPCVCTSCITSTSTTTKPGACNDNDDATGAVCLPTGNTFMYGSWTVGDGTYGGFYGLAKDGHVIYGPFNAEGELWGCDDVDLCNGFWLADGAYAYASTVTFPYMVGCWGPAPSTHVYTPSCTTNGCPGASLVGLSFSAIAIVLLSSNVLF